MTNVRQEERPFLAFTTDPSDKGAWLSSVLRERYGLSRAMIRRLKRAGCVLADGTDIPVRYVLQGGERIELYAPRKADPNVRPEPMPLEVIFEDDQLLALEKPAGMLVHPAGLELSGTLANGVAFHLMKQGSVHLGGPVTRLDRGTSGIALFAKHPHAHHRLDRALAQGELTRVYAGVCWGEVLPDHGTIDAPIRRVKGSAIEREIGPDGQRAVTDYRTLRSVDSARGKLTLVEFTLRTGRTHQIRVHAAHLGFPIVGDTLYAPEREPLIQRQALHASRLQLPHPISGRPLAFQSELPRDMASLL